MRGFNFIDQKLSFKTQRDFLCNVFKAGFIVSHYKKFSSIQSWDLFQSFAEMKDRVL